MRKFLKATDPAFNVGREWEAVEAFSDGSVLRCKIESTRTFGTGIYDTMVIYRYIAGTFLRGTFEKDIWNFQVRMHPMEV